MLREALHGVILALLSCDPALGERGRFLYRWIAGIVELGSVLCPLGYRRESYIAHLIQDDTGYRVVCSPQVIMELDGFVHGQVFRKAGEDEPRPVRVGYDVVDELYAFVDGACSRQLHHRTG